MSTFKKQLAGLLGIVILVFVAWGLYQAFQPQRLPLQGQMDAQEVNVSSKVAGRVGQVNVKLGDTVSQGQLLFQLTSPEVDAKVAQATAAAQAADAVAQKAQAGARPEDKNAASAQARQVGAVLTEAQVALAETKIAAPVAGQVSKIQIQPGELAPQGFPVMTLVNLADAWAVLQVREDEMAAFAMGSTHTANVPALKQQLTFKVSSVAVMPDFATWRAARPGGTDLRTFEIRLRPAIRVEGLRPGMSVVFPPL